MIELFEGAGLVGRKLAIGIGVFDGVHLGHQRMLAALGTMAANTGATPVALTFDPHPRAVLRPHAPPQLLISLAERIRLLKAYGAAEVVIVRFTPEFSRLSPEAFLDRLLDLPATVTGICVGAQWRFGAGGAGDAGLLAARCRAAGTAFTAVPELELDGVVVSSSNIRRAVAAGRLEEAAAMLGRPYRLTGTVEPGFGAAGKDLDCPTANVRLDAGVLPPDGVYAARALTADGRSVQAAVNIGLAPTFARTDGGRRLEAHLLDFAGNLYGQELTLDLIAYLRAERNFSDTVELKRQIAQDLAAIRKRLEQKEA